MSSSGLIDFIRATPDALGKAVLTAYDDNQLSTLVSLLPKNAVDELIAAHLDAISAQEPARGSPS